MVEFLDESKGSLLAVRVTRVVDEHIFEAFNPELEKVVEDHNDPRFYMELPEFDKVTPKAIFEDLKNLPHYNKFTKVAIVGDARWKKMVTEVLGTVLKPGNKIF